MRRKALKPKRGTGARRSIKLLECAEHNEETAEIYRAVEKRSAGVCECGCGQPFSPKGTPSGPEMDHFFNRRHGQSVQECWMIRTDHHDQKTRYRPSRLHWLHLFRAHCLKHGYAVEVARCDVAIRFYRAKHGVA
jgi:hypothetical protein